MAKFKVVLNNVLLRKHEPDTVSELVFVPDIYKGRSEWGTVVQTGNDVTFVKCGDSMFIPPHEGTHISINNEPYVIVKEQVLIDKSVVQVTA